MARADRRRSGEFAIIRRYFAPLAKGAPLAFGLTDDAAAIRPRAGYDLVVTTDAIAEGVHFLPTDPPEEIARKLLRVSISDLAAKGARPLAYTLTTAFRRDVPERWIAAFARGLRTDQRRYGCTLIGGDTTAAPDALYFSATLWGEVPRGRMVRRAGARLGDIVWVTGTIGDGALGLLAATGQLPNLSPADRRALVRRYRRPEPRLAFGLRLRDLAHAALDVSDGLAADLDHLAAASGVRVRIEAVAVPLSGTGRRAIGKEPKLFTRALTGGDDYEIVFCTAKRDADAVLATARATRTRITPIGRVEKGAGVVILDDKACQVRLPGRGGYDHFVAPIISPPRRRLKT